MRWTPASCRDRPLSQRTRSRMCCFCSSPVLTRPPVWMREASGPSILGPSNGFLCIALVSGSCWLSVHGAAEPVLLRNGECAVLPKAPALCIASNPALPPVDLASAVPHWPKGGVVTWQGGGACVVLSAFFTFASGHSDLLLEVLPPVLHLDDRVDRSALRWYLESMMAVLRDPQPGSVLQGEYLGQLTLLEILRLHAAANTTRKVGWLSALASPQLAAAIAAIHQRPGLRWTVKKLAEHARMSRSAFAKRFKVQTGIAVMAYLVRWRMLLAADRLVASSEPVGEIARSLGYESESAFSFAFKREMGCSPRNYSKRVEDNKPSSR